MVIAQNAHVRTHLFEVRIKKEIDETQFMNITFIVINDLGGMALTGLFI